MTVTLLDGIVLARSAFNTSMSYRSVVVLGRPAVVEDRRERLAALEAFLERLVPGHWPTVRPPTEEELRRTTVVALDLDEVSVKVSEGPPDDDDADLALPVWAGVLPLATVAGVPVPDPRIAPAVTPPASVVGFRLPEDR